MKMSRYIDSQILEILMQAEAGTPVLRAGHELRHVLQVARQVRRDYRDQCLNFHENKRDINTPATTK